LSWVFYSICRIEQPDLTTCYDCIGLYSESWNRTDDFPRSPQNTLFIRRLAFSPRSATGTGSSEVAATGGFCTSRIGT